MFVFAEITPRWPAASAAIRLCNATDRRAQTWNGQKWAAGIVDPGEIVVDLFSGEFGGEIGIGIPAMTITTREMERLYPASKSVRWESADVRIWAGEFTGAPGVGSYPYANDIALLCEGQVSKFEKEGDKIKLRVDPQDRAGRTNVLTLEYAGTGGAEGAADKKGTLKPWVFGYAKNVEPVLINEDDNIYQFSGYGPIQAVTALYERAANFGASFGNYANYAALLAAAVPEGRWATCLAEGLIKLGAPQYGVITGDVQGHLVSGVCIRKTGAILSAIAAARGLDVNAASMTALDAFGDTLPGDAHMSLVLTEQTDVLSLARRLCAPLNAQAGVSLLGELFAVRINLASPTFTLESRGKRLPLVSGFSEADTPPPFKKIVMGADPSWRVHNLSSEVAFFATLLEVGIYDAGTVYREGNIASIADGSRWVYVNPTATSGNAPFDGSVYWERLSAAATGPAGAGAFTLVSVANATVPTPSSAAFTPTSGFNGRVKTVESGVAASISCDVSSGVMLGLTSDPDSLGADGYRTIDFAFHKDPGTGNFFSYHNSASPSLSMGGAPSAVKMRVTTDGTTVYYWCDTVLMGSTSIPAADIGKQLFGVVGHSGAVTVTGIAYAIGGTPPPLITLTSTHKTFRYDSADAPLSQTTTLKATRQNTDGVTEWRYLDAGGTPQTTWLSGAGMVAAFGADSSPDNDTLILNQARFQANIAAYGSTGIIVEARISTATSIQARESLVKIADGAPGNSNAVVRLYQRSATSPAAPTGTFTYTFATGVLSGGSPGAWTQADPADNGLPKWVIAAVASAAAATDSIPAAEFSSPVIDLGSGTKAVPLFLYRRSASAPAAPTATLTYTFADNSLAGDLEGAVRSIADTTGTNPVWVRQAVATGSGATDSIAAGEWSAWEQVFADGAAGDDALTVSMVPPAISVPSTFNGTPKAAVPGFQITVYQGGTNVSASATYGTIVSSGVSGAAVDSDGTVTVTGMTADTGYVEVPITFGGISATARVGYVKVKDGNAAVSGSANVASLTNSGTYASSANFNVSLANGQTFNANANVSYLAASGTYTSQMKLAYVNVTDGGAETDMAGSEATGGTANTVDPETNSTSGSFTNSSGGTKVFNIRLLTRRSAGSGNSTSVTGSVGGSG